MDKGVELMNKSSEYREEIVKSTSLFSEKKDWLREKHDL